MATLSTSRARHRLARRETSPTSRRSVLHNGDGTDAIVIKGRAERVTERDELERVDQAYRAKYVDPHSGASATIFIADDHVYRVIPRLVMAWSYADMTTRTDWRA